MAESVDASNDVLQKAVKELNATVSAFDIGVQFEVREGHRIVVRMINRETQEVIREIPPTAVLDVVEGLRKLIGLLLDKVG